MIFGRILYALLTLMYGIHVHCVNTKLILIIINVNVLCSTNLSSCLSSSESIQHCSQVLLSPISNPSVLQSCHHHGHLICFRAISSRLVSHVLRSERMEGEGDR